jgi:hypothetical protein
MSTRMNIQNSEKDNTVVRIFQWNILQHISSSIYLHWSTDDTYFKVYTIKYSTSTWITFPYRNHCALIIIFFEMDHSQNTPVNSQSSFQN